MVFGQTAVMRTLPVRLILLVSALLLGMPGAGSAATVAPLDPSWGRGGSIQLLIGNTGGAHTDLAFDSRGRVYAIHGQEVRIVRMTAAGAVDMTWATRGMYSAPRTTDVFVAGARVFLVRGLTGGGGKELKRLTDRGALDTTFGTRGIIAIPHPAPGGPWVKTLHLSPRTIDITGNIVSIASGGYWRYAHDDIVEELKQMHFARAPISAFAQRRPTFTTTTVSGNTSYSGLDSIGRPWFVDNDELVRYGASGPEPIGANGTGVTFPFDWEERVPQVIAHGTGIAALGRMHDGSWEIRKLDGDGIVDPAFGGDGSVSLSPAIADPHVMAFRATRGGVIDVAIGEFDGSIIELHRLDATGAPLGGFGTNGTIVLRAPIPPRAIGIRQVAFDPSDRAYLTAPIDGRYQSSMVRRFATDSADLMVRASASATGSGWKRVAVTTTNAGPRSARAVIQFKVPTTATVRTPTTATMTCRVATARAARTVTCTSKSALPVGARLELAVDVKSAGRTTAAVQVKPVGRRDARPATNRRSVVL